MALAARLAVAALLLGGVAGCGGDGDKDPPTLSANQKAELADLTERARSAARADDRVKTRRVLSALQNRIATLRDANRLSTDDAASLITAVDQAQARATAELPPVTEITPAEPVPPSDGEEGDDEEDDEEEEEGEDD